eukprot:TRINITY_DN1278_c0_g1_i4.p1 TRINITY_DN1278_c0_g1~~TRINITY_DN1278_c0_g1_i4.p1  ORF type:complete len:243 (+),score=75.18 TRINITY_DN1278_c0_g1_i4:79-807(+)
MNSEETNAENEDGNQDEESGNNQEETTQNEEEDLKPTKVLKPVSAKKLKAFQEKQEKKGVVYLSRIPPFVPPSLIRERLSAFGEVTRVYLVPESEEKRKKKNKSRKKRSYEEGWVEFADKKVAKKAAEALHLSPFGGKRHRWYNEELWNIKYLKNFIWSMIHEEKVSKNIIQKNRLRAELSQVQKENNLFLRAVDRSKFKEKQSKKRKQQDQEEITVEPSSLDQEDVPKGKKTKSTQLDSEL